MQARRAARELSLILFSQLNKKFDTFSEKEFEDIILKSVRTLTNSATEDLKIASQSLLDIREFIDEYEANDPTNLERPIGLSDKPVALPMTSDMVGKIDELMNVSEKAMMALEIAEMTALQENSDVKDYILKVVDSYRDNHESIDEQIKKFAHGWDINRLVKIDKDILRIAIAEMLFVKEAPLKVIIDEAVELAKKYSTDDSASFVNGILGKVVIDNDLK
ncbi:MAG: transcription antitermination factor NusB [Candidatus Gastranaerophilales bacterium]|nr:transcription antitermination factor NusB [Candidatus Gastranaerophilales bacterium]